MQTEGVKTIQFKMAKMNTAPLTEASFFLIETSLNSQ